MSLQRFLKPSTLLLFGACASIGSGLVYATSTMPPAGFVIGNQAAAEYTIGGQVFKVTSNLVETVIAEKAAVVLTNSQTQYAMPGSPVSFPHQIVNTGNIADTFTLASANMTSGLSSVAFYADVNSDGVPDSGSPITTTPVIGSGETYNIVVTAMVPATVAIGATETFDLSATSKLDTTVISTNTNTVNVTNNAIVSMTKSMKPANPAPGDTVTITLTYSNGGGSNSGAVTIEDTLPANLSYVPGSGEWGSATGTVLTDGVGGDPTGINYDWNVTKAGTVTAVIDTAKPGNSVILTFKAKVDLAAPAGTITNYGNVTCDCGGPTPIGPTPTNPASVVAKSVPAVQLTDTGSSTDVDGLNNGEVTPQGPFYSGSVVLFDNVLINKGNLTDTFNISTTASSFPQGTTFTFAKADGVTPLTDTNGDGILDTGPMAAGETMHVFMRAQLPPGASGTGPFKVTKVAVSVTDFTVTSSVIDAIGAITGSTVDLTNTTTGSDSGVAVADGGWGPGPETVSQTTLTSNPGSSVTFDLYLNHSAAVVSSYLLDYSTTPTFASINDLPTGWSVTFLDSSGNTVTSLTANAAASGGTTQVVYTAKVMIPAGAPAGDQPIYFRVRSTALGISDIKFDQVTVNTVHDAAIIPNNLGQVAPGETKIFTHNLHNLGNITETSGTISVASSDPNWTVTAFLDVNNNGLYEPGTDPVFTNISQITGGLLAGSVQTVFVRVQAPASALPGDSHVATVTVTVTGDSNVNNNTASDQTSAVSGSISLLKEQAPDANCDGINDSTFSQARITIIKPGQCVMYRVTATNVATATITNVNIEDSTPEYSVANGTASIGGTAAGGSITASPSAGNAGAVTATWPTMNPSETAVLNYAIQIQ